MTNQIKFPIFIFILILFTNSCKTTLHEFKTHYAYEYRGFISFYWKADESKLEKLRDQLAQGNRDTCFVFCHAKVYKNLSMKIDSVTYQCIHDKKLNQKILDKFGENLKPVIIDTNETKIGFEPYECIIQISMETGANKTGRKNIIQWGYSRKLK